MLPGCEVVRAGRVGQADRLAVEGGRQLCDTGTGIGCRGIDLEFAPVRLARFDLAGHRRCGVVDLDGALDALGAGSRRDRVSAVGDLGGVPRDCDRVEGILRDLEGQQQRHQAGVAERHAGVGVSRAGVGSRRGLGAVRLPGGGAADGAQDAAVGQREAEVHGAEVIVVLVDVGFGPCLGARRDREGQRLAGLHPVDRHRRVDGLDARVEALVEDREHVIAELDAVAEERVRGRGLEGEHRAGLE